MSSQPTSLMIENYNIYPIARGSCQKTHIMTKNSFSQNTLFFMYFIRFLSYFSSPNLSNHITIIPATTLFFKFKSNRYGSQFLATLNFKRILQSFLALSSCTDHPIPSHLYPHIIRPTIPLRLSRSHHLLFPYPTLNPSLFNFMSLFFSVRRGLELELNLRPSQFTPSLLSTIRVVHSSKLFDLKVIPKTRFPTSKRSLNRVNRRDRAAKILQINKTTPFIKF